MKVPRMLVAAVLIAGSVGWMTLQAPSRFPHARHAKLFPTCAGCHAGILSGDSTQDFPTMASCARCHDGKIERQVTWSPPARRASNLKFSHLAHVDRARRAGVSPACASCHGLGGDTTRWMRVAGASPDACIACHAHRAPQHLADAAVCTTCHVPVAQARGLSVAELAAFPRPPSHDTPGWASAHAPRTNAALAQCATCHARESCARCHPNASQLRAITQLESDARVAQLVRDLAPAYPTPASHRADGWPLDHGRDAQRAAATCANCHTQQGCKSCHIGALGAQAIQALPLPAAGAPAGIVLRAPAQGMRPPGPAAIGPETTYTAAVPPADTMRARTVRVHPPGFATNHKEAAASGRLNCLGCHQQRQCTTCHDGVSVSRAYHPPDFMSRHATDAYSQQRDCSSCHRVETFCRSCHRSQGTPNTSSVRGSAHTAQPLWLLQHGQAARQGLTGCTSCHQQRDCLQCHSQLGRNINPHGPAFDAQAMGSRNKQVCLVCHVTDPLRK